MNALAVQNPHHKCDLGNNLRMIQSLTRETIFDCNNNYYNYYTEITLYLRVYALQLTLQVLLAIYIV